MSNLQSIGLVLEDVRYFLAKSDEKLIRGLSTLSSCVCVKTIQNVIIGIYDKTIKPQDAINTVEKLADFLIKNKY